MSSAKGADHDRARKRQLRRLSAGYFVASLFALIWPVYPALGNHIEPRVLGIPWSFAYVLLVIASNFVVLTLAYRARIVEEDASGEDDA